MVLVLVIARETELDPLYMNSKRDLYRLAMRHRRLPYTYWYQKEKWLTLYRLLFTFLMARRAFSSSLLVFPNLLSSFHGDSNPTFELLASLLNLGLLTVP